MDRNDEIELGQRGSSETRPGGAGMIPETVRSRWERERIENIHDTQGIAEKYGWQMIDLLIEMEIERRKWELQDGRRKSFFNSEQESRANRWLKQVLSHSDPGSRIVRLLSKTP